MTSAHSLWSCYKVSVLSDNPEYAISWYLSGPMGVRLKGFYCCSNAEFCNKETAVITDNVQRCTDKFVTTSMHIQFSTANLFVFHFQKGKCTYNFFTVWCTCCVVSNNARFASRAFIHLL